MFGRPKEDWQNPGFLSRNPGRISVSWEVLICVFALLAIGSVMVYSATSMFADNSRYGVESSYFILKHFQSIAVGLFACWIVYQIPMSVWYRYAFWVFMAAIALLVLVLVPGIGKSVNGARRWIGLGVMNLQVSEMMKVAALIMAAWFTVRRQDFM
ncbi:MAG: FtsW/RodA/SpoVE family cell cycle protein, partial [Sutterella sp.]